VVAKSELLLEFMSVSCHPTNYSNFGHLSVTRFDPASASPALWLQFHTFREQRWLDDQIEDPRYSNEQTEKALKTKWPLFETTRWIMHDGSTIFACLEATIRRPGSENYADYAHHIDAWIGVIKTHQRFGLGTALLRTLAAFMTTHDQRTLSINARSDAGHAFLTKVGAQQKLLNLRNKLSLDCVDWERMTQWRTAIDGIEPHLVWEIHEGRVPFERWATLYEPLNTLLSQMPTDGLNQTPIRYEEAGVRAWYADLDRTGGKHHLVLLKDSASQNARLIAVSNGYWDSRTPEWIAQQLTSVVEQLRGLGIAKAVKARMVELIRDSQPNVKYISTYNAQSNKPMLAINQQMGFTLVRKIGIYQIERDELKLFLEEG
jgi:GNAT superfamily N-acetyltransferase